MGGIDHATPGIFLVIIAIFVLLWLILNRKDLKSLFVRRIPGIDAVDEAVGRAAEMGRPSVFCTGLTGVGPVLYACLGVLYYVSKRVAALKSRLIVPQNTPEALAIVESTVRDGFSAAARSYAFDPTCIVFLSDDQFAFASGYMGIVHRENAGSAFLFGQFAAESLILAEAGQQVGAMQVAATVSPEQVAFFVCSCDYTLIGEELFAASAYLSREEVQLASLRIQDLVKLAAFSMIVIGVLIATYNSFSTSPISNVDSLLTGSKDWFGFIPENDGRN